MRLSVGGHRTRRLGALAIPLALLVLAGCSGDEPTPQASQTPTAAAGPTASPTPTPVSGPSGRPDLILSPEGVGPFRIDNPVEMSGAAADYVVWDDTICGAPTPAEDRAAWSPTLPLTADGKYPFFPMIGAFSQDARLIRIAVMSDDIRTAEGMGIGSPIADLSAVYGPDLTTVEIPERFTAHVLTGDTGQLIFWEDSQASAVFTIDVLPRAASVDFAYTVGYCA